MPDLPVMLNVEGRRCVVVGGGAVAVRRVRAMAACGAKVTVVAPRVDQAIEALAADEAGSVVIERRGFETGDLEGVWLVVIATDDPALNEGIAREARQAGALVNRADDPSAGDVTVPAHARHGPITIAVHTGGISATAGATIRRELSAALDSAWPGLLETIAPYRERIQALSLDDRERQARLMQLAGDEARKVFREQGEDGLRRYCEAVVAEGTEG